MSKARDFLDDMSESGLSRERALKDVLWVLDSDGKKLPDSALDKKGSILVGWQTGFEPSIAAVQGDGDLTAYDAEEIAKEFLVKKKWFSGKAKDADFIIMPS